MALGIPNQVTGGSSAGSESWVGRGQDANSNQPGSRAQMINFGNSPSNASSSNPSSPSSYTDYSFAEYLEGLFSSVGAEQELNRLFNAEQAQKNREFQSSEAAIQRAWYEEQSNSSYQRAVRDLVSAGLNPVLAVSQGGASVSSTAVPAGSNASVTGAQGDTLSSVLNALASVASSVAEFLPSLLKSKNKIGF